MKQNSVCMCGEALQLPEKAAANCFRLLFVLLYSLLVDLSAAPQAQTKHGADR